MATHSITLAWEVPWTEEPGGLQSMGSQRAQSMGSQRHDLATKQQRENCDSHTEMIPSVQLSSVAQSCPTLFDPMNRSTPGLPVHHQLLEFTQTHVHCVGDAIQPSHPLSFPSPPALNLSQHQGLCKWVSFSHQVTKVLQFQLQHQSFQWTPGTDLL